MREKQKDLEGYKEKTDTLIDTISGVVTGVGATAGAVGAANAGDAVVGAVGTTAAESVAGGLEAAGLALDASGVGVVAGIMEVGVQ